MRIVVTGATGNVGTSLVRALAADERVQEIVAIARRRPAGSLGKVAGVQADIVDAPLEAIFAGADAVIHLAWLIQPSRDERVTHSVNVDGSRRVFEAAAAAGVGTLVHASSIGAYSPGPKDRGVDETWPTGGIESSFYSRHKVAAEGDLDRVQAAHPEMRVVRLRPGLIFKGEAGTEIRRLFAGPLLPAGLMHPRMLRLIPQLPRLVFQAVHTDDVAEAYRLVALDPEARGAYNVAAEPVLNPDVLAETFGARKLPLPVGAVRALTQLSWKLRLQPTPPGWLDMALAVPVMSTARVSALGWSARHSSVDALRELLYGMAARRGLDTPPLDPDVSRVQEISQGVGARNPG